MSICIPESEQKSRNALVHSFSAVGQEEMDYPHAMIGRFTVTRQNNSNIPKLYLVGAETFDAPTIGIPNIGWSECMQMEPHYLFLFRRRVDRPTSWHAMIEKWQLVGS